MPRLKPRVLHYDDRTKNGGADQAGYRIDPLLRFAPLRGCVRQILETQCFQIAGNQHRRRYVLYSLTIAAFPSWMSRVRFPSPAPSRTAGCPEPAEGSEAEGLLQILPCLSRAE